MNQKIREHLENYCKRRGYDISNEDLMEVVTESKIIDWEITNSHRWYDNTEVITEVDGMFLKYDGFHITGDNSCDDLGLKHDLNSLVEVVKTTKTIEYYKEVKN